MGLVATMRDVQTSTKPEELNRYNPERPIMVDGSLSELVTHALNIAYSKRSMTTGDPFYGNPNPTGNPAPGAGFVPNIQAPDANRTEKVVRPTLEGMQMHQEEAEHVAAALSTVLNAKDKNATSHLAQEPLLVYALPADGMVSVEMNADIDMYAESGAVDIGDFVFVFSDNNDPTIAQDYRPVDLNQRVKDYEGKGARVYKDLQSFLIALPDLRRK